MNTIFISLLFLIPILVLPFGVSYFETPKVIVSQFFIELLLVLMLLNHKLKGPLSSRFLVAMGGLFLLSISTLIFHWGESTTFWGNAYRLQGILLMWHLLVLGILSALVPIRFPGFWFFSGVIILHGLNVLLYGQNINHRFVGSVGEPNALAAIMLAIWPLLFITQKLHKRYYLIAIGMMVIVVAILLSTGSLSGLLGFGLQSLWVLLLFVPKVTLTLKTSLIASLLLLSFFLPTLIPTPYESRAQIWETAYQSGWEQPIWGHGFGRIDQALRKKSLSLGNNLRDANVDSAHNIWLDYWVQGGILGLGTIIFLIGGAFYRLIQQQSIVLLLLLIGLLTSLSFNPMSVGVLVLLWWLIGYAWRKEVVLEN